MVCVASLLLLLALWQFRSRHPANGQTAAQPGNPTDQIPTTPESSSSGDVPSGPSREFRPAFQPTAPGGQPNANGPRMLDHCFAAPDLSGRPHPKINRAEWVEWRKVVPFSVLLGDEELQRIQTSEHGIAFNNRAREARKQDLLDDKNMELWAWQDETKAKTESLSLQQRADEVIKVLGEPTLMIQHRPRLEGETLVLEKTYDRMSLEELLALEQPFSYYYQPEGWDRMPPDHHHLRKLQVDFTADGKLFQWSFNPLPNLPDW